MPTRVVPCNTTKSNRVVGRAGRSIDVKEKLSIETPRARKVKHRVMSNSNSMSDCCIGKTFAGCAVPVRVSMQHGRGDDTMSA